MVVGVPFTTLVDRDELRQAGEVGGVRRLVWTVLAAPLACGGGDDAGDGGSGGHGSDAASAVCGEEPQHSGDGTYYDADGSGNCMFDPSPDDLMVAAMNEVDYGNSAACGACAEVEGPDGLILVRIVDRCPECAPGDLDFSREAFAMIAPIEAGRVDIRWRYVECPVEGPMSFRFKEGSNPYWTAIQVRDHRQRIAQLEARAGGGNYQAIAREQYNYFVAPEGLGEGPYDVRVTDVYGHVVEEAAVPPGDGVEVEGTAQLPACE
jgi:expansin (peptidoglycan-binding protein)